MKTSSGIWTFSLLLTTCSAGAAESETGAEKPVPAKSVLAEAPAGFDVLREGIARGKVETVEYDSKTVGIKRKMMVYTPPGYSTASKYPVLYLLH